MKKCWHWLIQIGLLTMKYDTKRYWKTGLIALKEKLNQNIYRKKIEKNEQSVSGRSEGRESTGEISIATDTEKYPKAYIEQGYFKEWDIYVPELGIGVEVKSDQKSQHTGNIVIEIEFNGKPSALSTTKATYWVIYDGMELRWFLPSEIKRCIMENDLQYAIFTGRGDTKSKKGILNKKRITLQV